MAFKIRISSSLLALAIGHFFFTLQQQAFSILTPLLLAKKGFSSSEIGLLWSIIPFSGLLAFPLIGGWSDRLRTRWGRRRPLEFIFLPVLFFSLLIFAYTDHYLGCMATLFLIGVCNAGMGLQFALFNDVVPSEKLTKFIAIVNFIGIFSTLFLQMFLLRYFDTFPTTLFAGIMMACCALKLFTIFFVKEGEHPPQPASAPLLETVKVNFKEGFSNFYIIYFWMTLGMTALGGPAMATYFNLFFTDAQNGLGYSSQDLGELLSLGTFLGMVFSVPAGWVVHRFGPKKLWSFCGWGVGLFLISMSIFKLDKLSITLIYSIYALINTAMGATLSPMMFAFLPKDKFGQLTATNSIISSLMQIIGVQICGFIIFCSAGSYQYVFAFGGLCYLFAPFFLKQLLKHPYPYGDMKPTIPMDGFVGSQKSEDTSSR